MGAEPSKATRLPQEATNAICWATTEFFPVVLNRATDGFSMADMEDCLVPNERALLLDKPFVTLRDFRALSGSPDALQRRRLAKWQDEWRSKIQANCLGVATVTQSQIVRGAMKAIFWVSPPPIPEEVFLDLPSAARFLRERLATRGVGAPPLLVSLEQGKPLPY